MDQYVADQGRLLEEYRNREPAPQPRFAQGDYVPSKRPLQVNSAEDNTPDDKVISIVNTSFGRQVPIKQFFWELMKPDYIVCIEGQRRSGKSNLVRNMLKANRRFYREVYIFTGTKISNEYKGLVPSKYIIDNLDSRPRNDPRGPGGLDLFQILWNRQIARKEAMQDRGAHNDENINILIIIEDLVANEASARGFHNLPMFNKAAFNGRHAHLGLWITSQNIKAVPPAIKGNTDMTIILTASSRRTKEAVRESFVDNLSNDQELDEVLAPLSMVEWSAFVFDRHAPRVPTTETIYMAVTKKIPKDFIMGDRAFWYGFESELFASGFAHLLDVQDWGLENTTYKWNPNGD